MDKKLIDFLTTNTQMARFTRSEVKEILARMEAAGWLVTKKPANG